MAVLAASGFFTSAGNCAVWIGQCHAKQACGCKLDQWVKPEAASLETPVRYIHQPK
jgi:hypothetical protein